MSIKSNSTINWAFGTAPIKKSKKPERFISPEVLKQGNVKCCVISRNSFENDEKNRKLTEF